MREVNECAAEIEPVDCLRIKTWGSCAGPGWRARIDGALPDKDFAAGRRFVRFGRAVGFWRPVFRSRCLAGSGFEGALFFGSGAGLGNEGSPQVIHSTGKPSPADPNL